MDLPARADRERRGAPSAIGLTLASALLWGTAHLFAGRTRAGLSLLSLQAGLIATILVALTALRFRLVPIALRPEGLTGLIVAMVLAGAVWVAVVVLSYRVVRPAVTTRAGRALTRAAVTALCVLIAVPFAHAARLAYVSRDVLITLFAAGGRR